MLGDSGTMEDYSLVKLKRKDLDDFSDDFSEFSLFSPARKIRRLDAELPPIVEEEESEMPFVEYSPYEELTPVYSSRGGILIEELPNEQSNEERAIVLYNPNNTSPSSFLSSSSSFSFSLRPQILSRLKNHVLLPSKPNILMGGDNEEAGADRKCLAVIPWTPSSSQASVTVSDVMDAQEFGEVDEMEVEENNVSLVQSNGDSFHQWNQQQQHCLFPQPPRNSNAPVNWYG